MSDSTPLRRGWTTGACATAAAAAAYEALLTGVFPDPVEIVLPGDRRAGFSLARESLCDAGAMAAVVKDAGDDPDVTHLAEVVVRLNRGPAGAGICLRGGEGIGVVTLPGLPVEVGKAAINPAPRRMIESSLREVAARHGVSCDVEVEISIPDGARLADRTWNPRLGIVGGLSVLGTTGVVIPYSCSAWIHAIHRGVDVARAAGIGHLAACTGSTSEKTVRALHDLPEIALIDMGDFAGGVLKYLKRHPVDRLTIGGGFAKLSKLAAGSLDLHSGRSQVDFDFLAGLAAAEVREQVRTANTASHALELAGVSLAQAVGERAGEVAGKMVPSIRVDVVVVDRAGTIVARTPDHRTDE